MNDKYTDEVDSAIDAALADYIHQPPAGIERRVLARISSTQSRYFPLFLRWPAAFVLAAIVLFCVLFFHPASRLPQTPNPGSQQAHARENPQPQIAESSQPVVKVSAAHPRAFSKSRHHAAQASPSTMELREQPVLLAGSEQALLRLTRGDPSRAVAVFDVPKPQPVQPIQISALQIQPLSPEESK